jgi:hypothetical protein
VKAHVYSLKLYRIENGKYHLFTWQKLLKRIGLSSPQRTKFVFYIGFL